MEIEFNSAIYKITNVVNNKCYIGSAVESKMSLAKKGKHKSEKAKANMKAAWVKRKAIKNNGWSTAWV